MIKDQAKSFLADLQELMSKYDVRIKRGSEQINASPYERTLLSSPIFSREIDIRFTQVILEGDEEWEEAMDYFNYGTKPCQLWEKKKQ